MSLDSEKLYGAINGKTIQVKQLFYRLLYVCKKIKYSVKSYSVLEKNSKINSKFLPLTVFPEHHRISVQLIFVPTVDDSYSKYRTIFFKKLNE